MKKLLLVILLTLISTNCYAKSLNKASDSDLLDGNDSTYYLNAANLTGTGNASVTASYSLNSGLLGGKAESSLVVATASQVSGASQPAITSVGTLTGLAVTGNIILSNIKSIVNSTEDGNDSGYLGISGGGDYSGTRGGIIALYGNEFGSDDGVRGSVVLRGGQGNDVNRFGSVVIKNYNTDVIVRFGNQSSGTDITTTLLGNLVCSGLGSAGTGTDLVINGSNNVIPKTSSRRFKKHIKDISMDSSLLYKLRPVEFDYLSGGHSLGFIAEDVNKVVPQLVNLDKEGKPYSLKTDAFSPLIIMELSKHNTKIHILFFISFLQMITIIFLVRRK